MHLTIINAMSLYHIIVITFLVALYQSSRLNWFGSWLRLPGTLGHELSHIFIGYALNGRPSGVNLIPRRKGKLIILGEALFNNITWYNGTLIGLAPLLLMLLAFEIDRYARTIQDMSIILLAAYIETNLILSALPSKTDLEIALKSILVPMFLLIILLFIDDSLRLSIVEFIVRHINLN